MNGNTKKRAMIVQQIVKENYEPGRQDRCKLWVFRNILQERLPMSESTFFKLLKVKVTE